MKQESHDFSRVECQQRFMDQKLFEVKEVPTRNGKYLPQTFATTKGVDYIRKLMAEV